MLLEMTEEVCRRTRSLGKMGRAIHVYCRGADLTAPPAFGFSRQKRLPEPFDSAAAVYPPAQQLFRLHWGGRPIRAVGVSLSGLVDRRPVQLSLTGERERQEALNQAVDQVRERFDRISLFRAASLTTGAPLFQRAGQIGVARGMNKKRHQFACRNMMLPEHRLGLDRRQRKIEQTKYRLLCWTGRSTSVSSIFWSSPSGNAAL